jgi:hypothetical protein
MDGHPDGTLSLLESGGLLNKRSYSRRSIPGNTRNSWARDGRMHLATVCRRNQRQVMTGFAMAAALTLAGCGGDGKIARYPVQGGVNIDGKPTAGVMVIFCPTDGPPDVQKLRPTGITGADGKFQLISVTPNDGAPAAHYKVLIQWPAGTGKPDAAGNVAGGEDRLHNRYMMLDQSPFSVEIKSGTNDLPPFEVKSK